MKKGLGSQENRLLALLVFLGFFLFATVTLIISLQRPPERGKVDNLMAASSYLHSLAAGSLSPSGMNSTEIVSRKHYTRTSGERSWNEYSTVVDVSNSFSPEMWLEKLIPLVEESSGIVTTRQNEGSLTIEICYLPGGYQGELLVETLLLRTRSGEDILPRPPSLENAQAALVIDDLGQNPSHLRDLLALDITFTASILPSRPYTEWTAREALKQGIEVLVHLPMEPFDYPANKPGPGALLAGMTEGEIREKMALSLATVPGASGVNNHMGSRLTADRQAMSIVMTALKERDLFFLDSRTSAQSVAFDTAMEHRLPTAKRDIFIDAVDEKEFIRGQVRKLLRLAKRKGRAIAIAHPYANTLSVLAEMKGEIVESGLQWVPVSRLMMRNPPAGDSPLSSLQPSSNVD